MHHFSDEQIDRLLDFVKSDLVNFWAEFTGGVHSEGEFFISGGIIPNLINMYSPAIGQNLGSAAIKGSRNFRSRLHREEFKKTDVDIWVNENSRTKVAKHLKPFRKRYEAKTEMTHTKFYYPEANAWHLNLKNCLTDNIQFIHSDIGEPSKVVAKFDLEHVKPYWIPTENKLFISPNQLDYCLNKKLIRTGKTGPLGTTSKTDVRVEKWKKRGYLEIVEYDKENWLTD